MAKREDKKTAKRIEIISNAMTLFKQNGYENVTTAEIAERSHIAKKTLFQYFPTKDAIVFNDDRELLEIILKYLQTHPENLWTGYKQLLNDIADQDNRASIITTDMFKLPQIIADSPTLTARMQVMWATYEREITDCLLSESLFQTPVTAQIFAAQMVLVFRVSFDTNQSINQIFMEFEDVIDKLNR